MADFDVTHLSLLVPGKVDRDNFVLVRLKTEDFGNFVPQRFRRFEFLEHVAAEIFLTQFTDEADGLSRHGQVNGLFLVRNLCMKVLGNCR